jgi:hypothetical protein
MVDSLMLISMKQRQHLRELNNSKKKQKKENLIFLGQQDQLIFLRLKYLLSQVPKVVVCSASEVVEVK